MKEEVEARKESSIGEIRVGRYEESMVNIQLQRSVLCQENTSHFSGSSPDW